MITILIWQAAPADPGGLRGNADAVAAAKSAAEAPIQLSVAITEAPADQQPAANRKSSVAIIDKVVARHAYKAEHPDELSFEAGDIVLVSDKRDTGWWAGHTNGTTPWPTSSHRSFGVSTPSSYCCGGLVSFAGVIFHTDRITLKRAVQTV